MKLPGEQLSLVKPAEGLCGVLLFNVAPPISTMLMEWLILEAYAPVELTEPRKAIGWLADSDNGLVGTRAAIFDLAETIDPSFLRQAQELAAVTIGISGSPAMGATRYLVGEWIDVVLPRSFRVRHLLAILEERLRSEDGPGGRLYEEGRRLR